MQMKFSKSTQNLSVTIRGAVHALIKTYSIIAIYFWAIAVPITSNNIIV